MNYQRVVYLTLVLVGLAPPSCRKSVNISQQLLRFVVYTCVAVILGKREALLATDKQFSLAEAGMLLRFTRSW